MSEFAPLYSRRERLVIVSKILAVAVPVYVAGYHWIFPWLRGYAKTANCDQLGAFSGLELLLYGVFVGMPLSMAVLLWLVEGRHGLRVWRLGQSPLPGEKVLRKTRYRYGAAARIRPLAAFAIIALLVGIAIRGGFEAHHLVREIGPCEVFGHWQRGPRAAAETRGKAAGKLLESATRQTGRNDHGSIQM